MAGDDVCLTLSYISSFTGRHILLYLTIPATIDNEFNSTLTYEQQDVEIIDVCQSLKRQKFQLHS